MPTAEDEDGSVHFKPDAWRVAWEAAQDVPAPSCEVKVAALRLVKSENVQQGLGWVVLTQIGLLLGSFGQLMSVGVCLLSFAIFMVEAMLKYVRSWAHTRFFMDVPCAFVPIHQFQETAHDSLKVFGRYLISAVVLELLFYVPFVYVVVNYCRNYFIDKSFCDRDGGSDRCPQSGTDLLVYLLIISAATTIGHWVTSFLTVLAFYLAMGRGIVALIRERGMGKQSFNSDDHTNWQKNFSSSCKNGRYCSGTKCEMTKRLSISRTPSDRVLCLTWWVHMARHRHLSAMVASAQPGSCGLPGHWFENVTKLKSIVDTCLLTGVGEQISNSSGPLWVSQEMGLRALVSLAKQHQAEDILGNKGFDLLVQVVREGKGSTCRGLAAAAIAVLATEHWAIGKAGVDLASAVAPLKRMLSYKDHELKEVALGALLNIALTEDDEQFKNHVLPQFDSSDGTPGASRKTFLISVMDLVSSSPTTCCQELAIGLLARLAADSSQARAALFGDRVMHEGIELLIELLQQGQTTEIKASAAGAMSVLAFKDGRAIGRGRHGEKCIKALIEQLRGEPRIVHASTRALCNLAIKCEESKPRIVSHGGIECFLNVLMYGKESLPESNSQSRGRKRSVAGNPQSVVHEEGLSEEAMAEAARALWILAYNNSGNQGHIAKAGGIPLLVKLLCNSRQKVYIQAVAALSALAWKNKKNQELIGQEGSKIFKRIVEMLTGMQGLTMKGKVLESNSDVIRLEGKVLEKVATAIMSFADGNKSNREDLRGAGALERLETLAQKDTIYNDKALKIVRQAIESLTGNKQGEPSSQ